MTAARLMRAACAATIVGAMLAPAFVYAQRPNPERVQPRAVRPAPAAVTAAPVAAVRPEAVIDANAQTFRIEVGKGTLIKLTGPAASVFVADPEIADIQVRSAGLVYVFGKKPGETVLYATDERERVLLNATVDVTHNLGRLRDAIRAVAPQEDVHLGSVGNSIVISGTVTSAAQSEEVRRVAARFAPDPGTIINQLKVTTPNQVNLRVRVAEVTKETLKKFGFNWDAVINQNNFRFAVATGAPALGPDGTFFVRNLIDGNITANAIGTAFRDDKRNLNVVIDALNREGLITILAEPNLTAMSGETASFLAGGEFPVPIPQSTVSNTITIEYKKFGVSLAFTPTLIEGERINMRVRPEVSQLTQTGAVNLGGFVIPALTTRRAETTVELGSGQSFAIAGLIQNNSQQDVDRTPWLGELPILGPLFRSDRYRRNESELVIIVTPYVVKPSNARLAAPTDGFVPPNDFERVLSGLMYRQQLAPRSEVPRLRSGQGLIGPAGFVLD